MFGPDSFRDSIILQLGGIVFARQFLEKQPGIIGSSDLFRSVALDPLLEQRLVCGFVQVGFVIICLRHNH